MPWSVPAARSWRCVAPPGRRDQRWRARHLTCPGAAVRRRGPRRPIDPAAADARPPTAGDGSCAASSRRSLRSPLLVVGLALTGRRLLVAGGVARRLGRRPAGSEPPQATARPSDRPGRPATPTVGRRAGIGDLLERRGRAVRDHDKRGLPGADRPDGRAVPGRAEPAVRPAGQPCRWRTGPTSWPGDGPALPKDRAVQLPQGLDDRAGAARLPARRAATRRSSASST